MSEAEKGARTPLEGARVVVIGEFPMQNVLPRPGETPGKVRWTGPKLGQHNYEVYERVLGPGEEERDGLRERGIV